MDAVFKHDGPHAGERAMINTKADYLQKLQELLKDHPDRDAIADEISSHIDECLECFCHDGLSENEAMLLTINQIGSPEQVAEKFAYISSAASAMANKLFICVNFTFFFVGGCFAVGANIFKIHALQLIWNMLSQSGWLILIAYSGYWALMGYEIGKEFGASGKELLKHTMGMAIVPNLILMFMTFLGFLPNEWFSTVLNSSFLIGCIIATILFFPISYIAYFWGVRKAF